MNKVNDQQETPLFMACKHGKQEVVELLLAADADINKANNIGQTALSIAAYYGYHEIVALLLSHNVCMIEYKIKMICV